MYFLRELNCREFILDHTEDKDIEKAFKRFI